jgi:hypothetical protein
MLPMPPCPILHKAPRWQSKTVPFFPALGQDDDTAEALKLYHRNRVERTSRVVETSDANRKLFHLDSVDEIRKAFASGTKATTVMDGCIPTTR